MLAFMGLHSQMLVAWIVLPFRVPMTETVIRVFRSLKAAWQFPWTMIRVWLVAWTLTSPELVWRTRVSRW
jgi:hypothetical protein